MKVYNYTLTVFGLTVRNCTNDYYTNFECNVNFYLFQVCSTKNDGVHTQPLPQGLQGHEQVKVSIGQIEMSSREAKEDQVSNGK